MTRTRVLVADDHPTILACVVALISTEYEIVAAVSDGLAAVDAALALQPDVVVLDISMPILTGLEAAVRLAKATSVPRIVFLSVCEGPEIFDAARDAGADGYVLKRNMMADLLPAIRLVLDGHSVFPTAMPAGEQGSRGR